MPAILRVIDLALNSRQRKLLVHGLLGEREIILDKKFHLTDLNQWNL
jgi:hypothetical protein